MVTARRGDLNNLYGAATLERYATIECDTIICHLFRHSLIVLEVQGQMPQLPIFGD